MTALKTKTLLAVAASALALAACGGDGTSELQNPGNTGGNPGTGGGGGGNGGGGSGSTGACPTHPNVTKVTVGTEEHCRISGEITTNLTLTAGPAYQLNGTVKVGKDVGFDGQKAGGVTAVLSIDPGVKIYAGTRTSQLAIQRGSRINAQGTAAQPIVLTSADALGYATTLGLANARSPLGAGVRDDPYSGEWGGLSLLGRGVINNCPAAPAVCEAEAEGGSGLYGGNVPNDTSGTLKYVRVEYAGVRFTETNELNAIAFWGVGSGTTVDYIQAHNGGDDTVEFFGGSVNVKHLVLTGADDDSFDWTFGWNGKAQHIVIAQNPLQPAGDAGYEADNNELAFDILPRSAPTIANATLVGNTTVGAGLRLRRGTAGKLYNHVVANRFVHGLRIDDAPTYAQADAGALSLRSFYISTATPFHSATAQAVFAKDANSRTGTSTLSSYTSGGRAYINGVNENGVVAVDPRTIDGFFDAAPYVGAVRDSASNWTLNWTRWLND
ncbi:MULTISPECIES: hypothetical protein [unclassified Brevundimonas]|uniref:hypothetical protein n=1 Tax=unclassified Brevundimonas TaxID=2622653 RepID=UPI003F8DB556